MWTSGRVSRAALRACKIDINLIDGLHGVAASTCFDFCSYRRAEKRAPARRQHVDVSRRRTVWQDIFGTEGGDLREVLRKQIDECNGVVQLVGKCYGAEPPQSDEKFGRVSYTHTKCSTPVSKAKKFGIFSSTNISRRPMRCGARRIAGASSHIPAPCSS